jgi:DNA polymerase-3 subunit alpha
MESLVLAGACDSLTGHRAQHFSIIDDALRWGQKYNIENTSAQESIFDDSSVASLAPPALPIVEEWTPEECLRHEKKTIGFYLSGDPLEKYKNDLYEFANIDLGNIPEKKPDVIKIGGIIRHVNSLYDKKNRPWAIVELNGGAGKADIFVFNETYEKYRDLLEDDACIFITGSPSKREDDSGELKMVAGDIYPLDQVRQKLSKCVNIVLDASQTDDSFLKKLKNLTLESDGLCRLVIHLKAENGSLQRIRASRITVNPAHKFIIKLRELFGLKHVWIS